MSYEIKHVSGKVLYVAENASEAIRHAERFAAVSNG
jgi:hypothetical protein